MTEHTDAVAIDGSLVPTFLIGIAEVLERNYNPIDFKYVFDADAEELKVVKISDSQVLTTIDY